MDWDNEEFFIKQLENMNKNYKAALAIKSTPSGMDVLDGTKAFTPITALEHAYKAGPAFSAPTVLHSEQDAIKGLLNELYGNYAGRLEIKRAAYVQYLRKGHNAPIAVHNTGRMFMLSERQVTDLVRAGLSAAEIKAVQSEAQDSLGGHLVPGEVSDQIFAAAAAVSVVRPYGATVDSPGRAGSIGIPSVARGSQDVYPSALRGTWSSELQQGSAENIVLGMIKPPINLWRVPVRVSKSLLEDAGARLVTTLNSIIGQTMGAAEDVSFLTGSGVGQPLGILAQQVAGTLSNADVRVTTTVGVGTIDADSVVNACYDLPEQYRQRAIAVCNKATLKTLRTLKDSSGRYVFNETDGTLCGIRVRGSESMPNIVSNAFPLLVADMSGYYIADHIALAIEVLDDSSLADLDQRMFNVRRRLGGTPGAGYRFSALKVK
jgi:HK97 family phage major capsid protein